MSSTNKKVLVIGLGSPQDPTQGKGFYTRDEVLPIFQGQVDQAKEAGLDLQVYQVDTTVSHDTTTEDLRAVLKKEKWDAVAIGFGVRGSEQLTPLFERMVNTVAEEVQPPPKFIFPLRPHLVWEAVSRAYGVQP